VSNSRRRIAVALYNLGDEIHPRDIPSEDISMTEEVGEAAEERRRKAREEILQRSAFLEARLVKRSSSGATTFETLVDKDGRLKLGQSDAEEPAIAKSTALDTGDPQTVWRHHPEAGNLTERRLKAQAELLQAIDGDRLRLTLPSELSSNHPSESLVDLTPTSEFPDAEAAHLSPGGQPPLEPLARSEYFSVTSDRASAHSEGARSDFYYAHPDSSAGQETANPFHDRYLYEASSASSIAGSLNHTRNDTVEVLSDGTLSDLGQPTEGAATPASWSEVGSVVSGDYQRH
jgi:hypothetical protein